MGRTPACTEVAAGTTSWMPSYSRYTATRTGSTTTTRCPPCRRSHRRRMAPLQLLQTSPALCKANPSLVLSAARVQEEAQQVQLQIQANRARRRPPCTASRRSAALRPPPPPPPTTPSASCASTTAYCFPPYLACARPCVRHRTPYNGRKKQSGRSSWRLGRCQAAGWTLHRTQLMPQSVNMRRARTAGGWVCGYGV